MTQCKVVYNCIPSGSSVIMQRVEDGQVVLNTEVDNKGNHLSKPEAIALMHDIENKRGIDPEGRLK